jgi:hypothetical protein
VLMMNTLLKTLRSGGVTKTRHPGCSGITVRISIIAKSVFVSFEALDIWTEVIFFG